jgi:hypothetical protein
MKSALLSEPAVAAAQAWRVTLDDGQKQPGAVVVREPRRMTVNTQAVAIDDLLSDSSNDGTGLSVIWLPTGDGVPASLEKSVERWINEVSATGPTVRATIRTSRVVWADKRALIYSAPDQWRDTLDAVLRFALMAWDTTQLEEQMKAVWAALNDHVPLSHAVSFRQVRLLQSRVSQMTEAVTRMRISFLQLQSAIEQTDLNLNSASKRLCAELILQAAIYDRLEVIEEPIQFALDHYELANTRLIEHKNAGNEYFYAAVITITLLFQTAIIFLEQVIK